LIGSSSYAYASDVVGITSVRRIYICRKSTFDSLQIRSIGGSIYVTRAAASASASMIVSITAAAAPASAVVTRATASGTTTIAAVRTPVATFTC
jgi:hypothetical protein